MSYWVDGEAADSVAIDDRGLSLGDGHFTTMMVRSGTIELWPLHQQRLSEGCNKLGFQQPDWHQLHQELSRCSANTEQGCLRLTLTRGSSGRGYQGQWLATPRRIVSLHAFPEPYRTLQQTGLNAELAKMHLACGGPLVGIKHLGRAEQILLKREAEQRNIEELIVTDGFGHVIEATASNLFFGRGNRFFTPRLDKCGIAGVMRQHLLQSLPKLGYDVSVRDIHLEELSSFETAFLTNSLMGMVPLNRIGQQQFDSLTVTNKLINKMDLTR